MIKTLAIANYRSIRNMVLPLGQLNLVVGANGSGKSNLYKSLRLLSDIVRGGIVPSLAKEGGIESALWAGPEDSTRSKNRNPVNLRLGLCDQNLGYGIDIGLPAPSDSVFGHDPEIKRECIFSAPILRPSSILVDRHGGLVRSRKSQNEWVELRRSVQPFDSMLTEVNDAQQAPEVTYLKEKIRAWRFYDHFRVDHDAPCRQFSECTRTPVLSNDGSDFVAALETIREIGDSEAMNMVINDAFPGAFIQCHASDGKLKLAFHQPGMRRPLSAAELSDGTLRFLLWVAALLSPRPPPLVVLNEPETSLHPELLSALGRLISKASIHSQVWVVSHASALVDTLKKDDKCFLMELTKNDGESHLLNQERLERPAWKWIER